jgi:hypothetical protein
LVDAEADLGVFDLGGVLVLLDLDFAVHSVGSSAAHDTAVSSSHSSLCYLHHSSWDIAVAWVGSRLTVEDL